MGWLEDRFKRKKHQEEQLLQETKPSQNDEEETFEPEDYFAYEGAHIVTIDLNYLEDWDPIDDLVGNGYQILAIDLHNTMILKKPLRVEQ